LYEIINNHWVEPIRWIKGFIFIEDFRIIIHWHRHHNYVYVYNTLLHIKCARYENKIVQKKKKKKKEWVKFNTNKRSLIESEMKRGIDIRRRRRWRRKKTKKRRKKREKRTRMLARFSRWCRLLISIEDCEYTDKKKQKEINSNRKKKRERNDDERRNDRYKCTIRIV